MHNPLRSEADAFRLAVIIGLGAALVIAVARLLSTAAGAVLAAALVGFGVGMAYRSARGSLPRQVPVGQRRELEEIRNHCRGQDCEILLVTPALVRSRAAHWASDLDEAIEQARRRMAASLRAIRGLGLEARGQIGDSDPNVAIEDALRVFPADEIVISTHPPERSRWLEGGVVERARDEIELPIAHVVVDLVAERESGQTPVA